MYYYDLVEMSSLPILIREAVENIYLLVNQKWDFNKVKLTEEMIKTFEKPEGLLSKLMAVNETAVSKSNRKDSFNEMEKTKSYLKRLEESGKLIAELRDEQINAEEMISKMTSFELEDWFIWLENGGKIASTEYTEKRSVLALFILKMAVYRFCMVYFPYIIDKSSQITKIDTKKLNLLETQMELWEKQFWSIGILEEAYCSANTKLIQNINDLVSSYFNKELADIDPEIAERKECGLIRNEIDEVYWTISEMRRWVHESSKKKYENIMSDISKGAGKIGKVLRSIFGKSGMVTKEAVIEQVFKAMEIYSSDISKSYEEIREDCAVAINTAILNMEHFKTLINEYKIMIQSQECIERAFEDMETIENVKKLQENFSANWNLNNKGIKSELEDGIVEIENMRSLLDIMERQLKGKLTDKESNGLKERATEWGKDIAKLEEMISKLC